MEFLGKKIGMTRLYDSLGLFVPVTVIELFPAVVIRKKEEKTDGYNSLQLGFLEQKKKKMRLSEKGYFRSQNVVAKKVLKEVSLSADEMSSFNVSQELNPSEYFVRNSYVDVSGKSKGKGFCGVIKRHNFSRGPETHGSRHHRKPGSVGSTGPSRIFKGKALPGRKGNKTVTVQSLKVIKMDVKNHHIYLLGSVPGHASSSLFLRPAVKKTKENQLVRN